MLETGDESIAQHCLCVRFAHVAVERGGPCDVMADLGQQPAPVGDVVPEGRGVERDEQGAIADPGAH